MARRHGSRTPDCLTRSRAPRPSSSRARSPASRPARRFRSSAATATRRSSRPIATTATPRSPRYTKEQARSSGWSSPVDCLGALTRTRTLPPRREIDHRHPS
jgi:hypothetical protein